MPHQHLAIANGTSDMHSSGPGVLLEGCRWLDVSGCEHTLPATVCTTNVATGSIRPKLASVVHLESFAVYDSVNISCVCKV